MTIWFFDSSIIISLVKGESESARQWYRPLARNGDPITASRLLEVETWQTVLRSKGDPERLVGYLSRITFLSVDDELMQEAINLGTQLRGADSIHVAAALRIKDSDPIFVTHDAEQAEAAKALGLRVADPVTDDPLRGPVAPPPSSYALE